jgi:MoaD family protein
MIKVKVIFGSYFSKEIGREEMEVDLADASVIKDLMKMIADNYGEQIANLIVDRNTGHLKVLAFVNGQVSQKDRMLQDQDVVKILPPLAGG